MANKRQRDSGQAQMNAQEFEELLRRAEDYYYDKAKHDVDQSAADEAPEAPSLD